MRSHTMFCGVPVRSEAWVWGSGRLWDPKKGSYPRPWKDRITMAFPRQGSGANMLKQDYPLAAYRLNPEKTLQCNLRGIGRVAADCWPIPGRRYRLCGSPGQFNFYASILYLFAPTKDGPAPTNRSESFREGLQVRQAVTYLLQTLDGGTLDPALAKRVNALVKERARSMIRHGGNVHSPEDEDALFALCAEAAAASDNRQD